MYRESFHVELGVLVNRAWTAPPEYLGICFTHPSTQRPLSHDLKGSATSQLSAEVGIIHVAVVRVARLHELSLPGSRKHLWSPMVAVVREERLHEHLLPGSRKCLWSPTVCGGIWGPAEPLWSQSMKEWAQVVVMNDRSVRRLLSFPSLFWECGFSAVVWEVCITGCLIYRHSH